MKSKKKAFEKLVEDFSSMEILQAVTSLDEIRGIVGDREINRPPEIREKLMRLHEMVMNERITSKGETIWDLANEIEDELYPLQEATEQIMDMLEKITDSAPGDDYE
jgi:predicted metal-dependent TIM-barrel fold hydrolase